MRRALQAAKPYAVIVLATVCSVAALYLLNGALVSMGVHHTHDHMCEESRK